VIFRASVLVGFAFAVAMTACGSSRQALPKNRLIVLGRSIGPISLGERRSAVTRTLGSGKQVRRGVASYFGGRLFVNYWFHDELTERVSDIETTWAGFHTRTGVRVGSSRRDLHIPRGSCLGDLCAVAASKGPDAPGTGFRIRKHKIARINVSYG
jgi:hypothetical protein